MCAEELLRKRINPAEKRPPWIVGRRVPEPEQDCCRLETARRRRSSVRSGMYDLTTPRRHIQKDSAQNDALDMAGRRRQRPHECRQC
jgi:hypothetical protein